MHTLTFRNNTPALRNPFVFAGLEQLVARSSRVGGQIVEHPDRFEVQLDVPGIPKGSLQIKIRDNEVLVSAVEAASAKTEATDGSEVSVDAVANERVKRFRPRLITLSEALASEGNDASIEDGVLTLKLMKKVPDEAKEISLTVR